MDYINPLFNNIEITTKKKSPAPNQSKKISKSVRAVRLDKCKNIKFPVNPTVQMKLKSYRAEAARIYKAQRKDPLSQTKFNTALLRFGLKHEHILSWEHQYKDTKVYMHTNILETEYIEIGGPHGLAIRKNLSERKVVYQVMLSVIKWLEGGGTIEKILQ